MRGARPLAPPVCQATLRIPAERSRRRVRRGAGRSVALDAGPRRAEPAGGSMARRRLQTRRGRPAPRRGDAGCRPLDGAAGGERRGRAGPLVDDRSRDRQGWGSDKRAYAARHGEKARPPCPFPISSGGSRTGSASAAAAMRRRITTGRPFRTASGSSNNGRRSIWTAGSGCTRGRSGRRRSRSSRMSRSLIAPR